ncbi:MAG: hypothetical protein QOK17_450 [Sphingomonadales bacterium]|jgi:uncharacterized protein YhaN|nr:hypothetical protein [Sphingomonadales bacterium]
MRFARLQLLKYGHFDGCDLDFPAADLDLQIVFGPNEAGKSTTMAAVSDLLFGFGGRTNYDFQHDQQLLRVGAVLECDGAELICRRRKGNKGTLLDENDEAIDDGRLSALLGGYTAENFSRMFSLDHHRLREGGKAIIEAEDDIGQAIFAAGSGLTGIAGILEALETEAKEIWTKGGRGERRYPMAQRAYEEARARQKEAQVRPAAWDELRKTVERLASELEDLRQNGSALELDRSGVERRRRVLPHAAFYRDAVSQLAAVKDAPVLPGDASDAFAAAVQAIAAADIEIRLATERGQKLSESHEAIKVDQRLVDQHDRVQALRESKGTIDDRVDHLPRRRADRAAHHERMLVLLRELGWEIEDAAAAAAALPQKISLAGVRNLLESHGAIETRLVAARAAKARHQAVEADLARELGALPPPPSTSALAAALRQAAALGDIDQAVATAERDVLRRSTSLSAAISRLAPWQGTAEALLGLAVPNSGELADAKALIEGAQEALEDARRAAQAETERGQELALSRTQLLRDTGAVTAEALAEARSRRDNLWHGIAGHVRSEAPLSDPLGAAGEFEASLADADQFADRRFDDAENSARAVGLDEEIERHELALEQKGARLRGAEEEHGKAIDGWEDHISSLGLDLGPADLAAWLQRREQALAAADEVRIAEEAKAEAERKRDEVMARLRLEMSDLGENVPGELSFKALQDRVSLIADAAQAADVAREKIVARQNGNAEDYRAAILSLDEAEAELAGWSARWEGAVRAAALDPTQPKDVIKAQLELLEELRSEVEEVRSLDQRIESMVRDIDQFAKQVEEAATACGVASTDRSPGEILASLVAAVAEAQTAVQRRADLISQVADADVQLQDAQTARARAVGRLDPLFAAAGTEDREELQEAIRRSDSRRLLEADLERHRSQILTAGGGPPLEQLLAECEESDVAALSARAAQLDEDIASNSNAIAQLSGELATARAQFERLDAGPDAALAAADGEIARAEMAEQAEAYVRKRAEIALLRSAIAKYRSSKQAPMLVRASQLFSRLTLGRFKELLVDFDSDTSRLAGITQDDRVVPVAGMSDGTIDQLFLALRLAAVEDAAAAGARLPFLADDLFINYDDQRAAAGFEVLGELARTTQVLFFTHHQHLVSIAEKALAPISISRCLLS